VFAIALSSVRGRHYEGEYRMIRGMLVVAALAVGVAAAAAQQDPIKARQELMKSNSAQARVGAAMVKGDTPFDLAKAKAIFTTYESNSEKLKGLWPAGSDKGDTKASPKIWQDKAGFDGELAKFASLAKAASASVTDLDSFKTQFGAIGKECGACHQTYRLKKS
jgi:cytochrome c556